MKLWLAKIVATRIIKAVKHKIDLKRIDKYVNKPNELDRAIKKHDKRLKALEKDSHPRADWICMDCGCKAKKVVKPKRRRKRKVKTNKEK